MIARHLARHLRRDAKFYPIVTLTGPRQSGKTTLARACFPDYTYVSLEDIDQREFAVEDPRGFIERYGESVIIDEAQRAPDLFSYLQTAVDKDDRPGRFVLTGSQNLLLMERISQSLAGRSGILHLLPFSRSELEQQEPLAKGDPEAIFGNSVSGLDCWRLIRSGFYPRIHERGIPPEIWLNDYLRTYVECDVRALVNVGDQETFERFLRLCAGRTGQLLNFAALGADCGIAPDTARRWISVLKTSFVVFLLRPHHENFNKRIIKSPKLYFYDTGLACALLGIRTDDQLFTHPARGALFENFIISEVVKAYTHDRRDPPLSFWRDQTGHEIDLLIEEAGQLYPVEIKSGATIKASHLEGLQRWNRLTGTPVENSRLIHSGAETRRQQDIAVCPWYAV
jgi:uncharacterized protein